MHRGIQEFYYESGMPKEDADLILDSLLNLHLLKHQLEAREVILRDSSQHATKGGVLEKSTQIFYKTIETFLKKQFFPHIPR